VRGATGLHAGLRGRGGAAVPGGPLPGGGTGAGDIQWQGVRLALARDSLSHGPPSAASTAAGRAPGPTPERAAHLAWAPRELQPGPNVRRTLLARLASLHKRSGRQELAAELWRELVALGLGDVTPLVELAKHCEHRQRDVSAALELVQEALTVLELREPQAL